MILLRCFEVQRPCEARLATSEILTARVASARAFLAEHGIVVDPIVVMDAPVRMALTVQDLGAWLGPRYTGQVGVLLAPGVDAQVVITHELVHVWLIEAGAREPRWVVEGGVANNEAALVQEALADFAAVVQSGDPKIGRQALPDGEATRSLAVTARCPEGLRGDAHDDALVLSTALWEAGRTLGPEVVLRAVAKVGSRGSGSVAALSRELGQALGEGGAKVWAQVAERHGLEACGAARPLGPHARVSAPGRDFVVPAIGDGVQAPQAFAIEVPVGVPSLGVSLRPGARDLPLSLVWRDVDGHGEVPLVGWPMAAATIEGAQGEVVVRVMSRAKEDVRYNDLRVTFASPAPPAAPVSSSSCGAAGADLGLWVALAYVWRRRR